MLNGALGEAPFGISEAQTPSIGINPPLARAGKSGFI
jgi:hypothetical protein